MRRHSGPDRHSSRGQSEIIGFILVFSMVLLATSGVVLFGLTALQEVQEASITDSSERAMEAISADMESLYSGTSMGQTAEVVVESGSLETGGTMTVAVTVTDGDLPGGSITIQRTLRPLVYSSERADVVYGNSLLIRDQGEEGAVAMNAPLGTFTSERTLFPILQTTANVQSVGGTTQRVKMVRSESVGRVLSETDGGVTVEIDGIPERHAKLWKQALNSRMENGMSRRPSGPPCDLTGSNEVQCVFDTNMLVVSIAVIEYELG